CPYPVRFIERHLAHESKEELGSAYDRAQFEEQRRQMVQVWADYLDQLKDTG
ncbi:MAG TPA: integrase, partial [Pusillimonas sp.]|nr:integrase [Pusillimonas sp.]